MTTNFTTSFYTGINPINRVKECLIGITLDIDRTTATFSTAWVPIPEMQAAWIDFSKGARDIPVVMGEKLDGAITRNARAYTFSAGGSALRIQLPLEVFERCLWGILQELADLANGVVDAAYVDVGPARANVEAPAGANIETPAGRGRRRGPRGHRGGRGERGRTGVPATVGLS
jgi:hypothetical protein